jgi:hypothetical protein
MQAAGSHPSKVGIFMSFLFHTILNNFPIFILHLYIFVIISFYFPKHGSLISELSLKLQSPYICPYLLISKYVFENHFNLFSLDLKFLMHIAIN